MDTPTVPALRVAEGEIPAGISGLPGMVDAKHSHRTASDMDSLCCMVTVAAHAGCDSGTRHSHTSAAINPPVP